MTVSGDSRRGSYVAVDDEYFQHSGLRGCRSCCLCTLLVILLIIGLLNAVVTAGLVYFLSITHEGMASVEFFPGGKYLRVLSDVHFDDVILHDGLVARQQPENETFTITGNEIMIGDTDGSSLTMDSNGTVLTTDKFELASKPLLSSKIPLNFDLYQVPNLQTTQLDVGSISTRQGISDLVVESNEEVELSGMEGVNVGSRGDVNVLALNGDMEVMASRDVVLDGEDGLELNPDLPVDGKGVKGDVILNGEEGIELNPDLPVDGKGVEVKSETGQYKLCVCGSTGKVFAVPIIDKDSGCHRANEDVNPCLD